MKLLEIIRKLMGRLKRIDDQLINDIEKNNKKMSESIPNLFEMANQLNDILNDIEKNKK